MILNFDHATGRVVALIGSLFVSLVAGTPYLYGVYSPQLVKHINLSTSDAATISLAVTIGSGLGGLPAGLFIDRYGAQKSIALGSLSIFCGYFALNRIYKYRIHSLFLVCLAMTFIGYGSVKSFFAGLKAAQSNFPNHRGAAGALPVGAYGLAATLFSFIAAKFFQDNTEKLLLFLAIFCGSIAFAGAWFVHVYDEIPRYDEEGYLIIDGEPDRQLLRRSNSLHGSLSFWGIGRRLSRSSTELLSTFAVAAPILKPGRDQAQGLNPTPSQASGILNVTLREPVMTPKATNMESGILQSSQISVSSEQVGAMAAIRSFLTNRAYLTHYVIVSLCSGIGQMYIYTVGFVITAQFYRHDLKGSPQAFQAIQVSVISISSFAGRVVAGLLSDFIHKRLKAQRLWVIIVTICILGLGQYLLINTNNMTTVTVVSVLMGTGYGLLNGTYPSIIADSFGTKNFTTAWGLICSGPLVVLFTLEKYFGFIFDLRADETGKCTIGNECYKGAFEASGILCVVALTITSSLMYIEHKNSN